MNLPKVTRVPAQVVAGAALVAAAGFAAMTLPGRAAVEAQPPAVEICVDFSSANGLALRAGVPVAAVLAAVRAEGASSAALSEETLGQYVPDPVFMRQRYGLAGGVAPAGRFVPEWWNDALPAGFAPEKRAAIAAAGLAVVLRPVNAGDPSYLVRDAGEKGQKILLDGRDVPGYPSPVPVFERLADAVIVVPEFTSPAGVAALKRSFPRRVVQAHALYPAEQVKISSQDTRVARWARAVSERGARFLLLYLDEREPLTVNRAYVGRVASAVRAKGFSTGETAPPAYPFGGRHTVRLILVMAAAVLFPCCAVVAGRRYSAPVVGFLAANTVTLLGGLTIASLLFDGAFMQRVIPVPGVKAALLLPLLLAPLALFSNDDLRRWWNRPVTVRYVVFAILAAALIAVFLVRSGNTALDWARPDAGMRSWLEQLLAVRPRTKEFLFGQPLLMAGFFSGSPWLVWLGMIGQVSVINTFMHAHTPVAVSLFRTIYGIIIGGCVGYAAAMLYDKTRRARRP